eukprot:767942-Hanusia_phi.AAC.4
MEERLQSMEDQQHRGTTDGPDCGDREGCWRLSFACFAHMLPVHSKDPLPLLPKNPSEPSLPFLSLVVEFNHVLSSKSLKTWIEDRKQLLDPIGLLSSSSNLNCTSRDRSYHCSP